MKFGYFTLSFYLDLWNLPDLIPTVTFGPRCTTVRSRPCSTSRSNFRRQGVKGRTIWHIDIPDIRSRQIIRTCRGVRQNILVILRDSWVTGTSGRTLEIYVYLVVRVYIDSQRWRIGEDNTSRVSQRRLSSVVSYLPIPERRGYVVVAIIIL